MLKLRVITGVIVAGILLAGLFFLPLAWAVPAIGTIFVVAAWEWAGFGGLASPAARGMYTLCITILLLIAWRWSAAPYNFMVLLGLAVLWWVIAAVWVWLAPSRHRAMLTLLCGAAVLVPAFVSLARLQVTTRGLARGPVLVVWLLLLVVAADVGAYFAGRGFGRHKMAPRVSPGKTWEGAAGGLVMVALVAWGGAVQFGLPVLTVVLFACGLDFFSVIGDLTESMFKRAAGLKDSGDMLPGHGGLLDRLDSATAAAPYYALGLFGSGLCA